MQLRTPRVALILAAAIVLPRAAAAHPYETFINVDDEEDLYDLHATGQIDDSTLAELVEVMQRGVDLNKADREELYSLPNLTYDEVDAILAYRTTAGWIRDPIDLVVNGVLSQEKLEAIAGFLVVSSQTQPLFATDGWIRSQTRWTVSDNDSTPPVALQARISTLEHLTVGMASTLSRNRISDVVYDPTRGALSARPADTQVHVPKLYARWEGDKWGAIAGTYRIGFGQRLTFDNTSLYTPNGFVVDDQLYRDDYLVTACKESAGELPTSPCTGPAGDEYTTPDYRWRDGLLGAAIGMHDVPVGSGTLQSYGFFSYQPRSIYQYELYDKDTCDDPRNDDDPACAAPTVYRRGADPLDPTTRFSYETLPDMYAEMTAGGNVSYQTGRRSHIGVTGYGSSVNWLTRGIDLDFQEWSRYPYGGPFGAVGADGAIGFGMNDLFGEVTRSFDSTPGGGGGFAGIVRLVTTLAHHNELETSVRYYDTDFKNPYARPIAAADELEGSRARDEEGVRLRYTALFDKRLALRAMADGWRSPSDGSSNILLEERSDLDLTDQYGVGLWAEYENKDLEQNGVGDCFSIPTMTDESGEPIPCAGEKYQVTGRFRYTPVKRYSLVAQYSHSILGDNHDTSSYRQDAQASLIATAKPTDDIRVRARSRYLFQDIADNTYLEQSLWSYIDLEYRLRQRDKLELRYDLYIYFDKRMNTEARTPSPEHWLWLSYESRF